MTNNQTTINRLKKLLELIETDCRHYEERRDNAFSNTVKDYYDKKIWRARLDFERISRRVNQLKRIRKE